MKSSQKYTINDKKFLRRAIKLAQKATEKGADPFGAILVYKNKIVAESYDKSVKKSDPTYHAELSLISEYCRKNKKFSLDGYTLYSSTEPCVMCSGAIHWSKISRLVFSVPQELLQKHSKGKKKPSCRKIINIGKKKINVVGPLLVDEGLKIFEENKLISKIERHQKLFK